MGNVSVKYKTEYERKARELISQMTLDEKVSQTVFNAPAIPRLGIKAYNWWNEALHGVARAGTATVFPQSIALAATFDEELLRAVGDCVSAEARAKFNAAQKYGDCDIYKGLTLWAPNVNIFRDPRWGRGHETYGEDPYLTALLGVAYINGLQGDDERYLKTAACAKHFAVHSGPESIRHNFNVSVSEPELSETYLYAFSECVKKAGVEGVMGAYNGFNGEPCCGNRYLLTDILRKKWGFDGYVVSDCGAIVDFYLNYGVAKSPKESAAMALKSGCDLNCGCTYPHLTDAVKNGLITEEEIDEVLTRLFVTRMKLGALTIGESTPYDDIPYTVMDSAEHGKFNLMAAERSAVLLKNNGILPLDKTGLRTVGVIGPNANSRRALVGNYEGTASEYVTVLEGLRDYLGDGVRVLYSEGCHLFNSKFDGSAKENDRISEVRAVCENSDVIIACFGLDAGIEGEAGDANNSFAAGDKTDLKLPGLQHEVIRTICESGKPTVLVMLAGSAIDLSWESDRVDAILQAWYPGARGGDAIAKLLFGECSPEGKLPVTFYRSSDDLPDFTDYSMSERTYRYMSSEPLYPFGYGLSYTRFELSNVKNSGDILNENGISLEAEIANKGKYNSGCTLQVYIKAENSHVPNPQLKRVVNVRLKQGESRRIKVDLPLEAFALYDEKGNRAVKRGNYDVYLGESQPDKRSIALLGYAPVRLRVKADKDFKL